MDNNSEIWSINSWVWRCKCTGTECSSSSGNISVNQGSKYVAEGAGRGEVTASWYWWPGHLYLLPLTSEPTLPCPKDVFSGWSTLRHSKLPPLQREVRLYSFNQLSGVLTPNTRRLLEFGVRLLEVPAQTDNLNSDEYLHHPRVPRTSQGAWAWTRPDRDTASAHRVPQFGTALTTQRLSSQLAKINFLVIFHWFIFYSVVEVQSKLPSTWWSCLRKYLVLLCLYLLRAEHCQCLQWFFRAFFTFCPPLWTGQSSSSCLESYSERVWSYWLQESREA